MLLIFNRLLLAGIIGVTLTPLALCARPGHSAPSLRDTAAPEFAVFSHMSVPASCISYTAALEEAKHVAAQNEDWQVMRCSGFSMNPMFGSGSILLVNTSNALSVREGMVVIYRDQEGDLISHQVIAVHQAGYLTQGLNNPAPDPERIDRGRIEGVVFGVFYTGGPQPLTRSEDRALPIVLGKSR